MRFASHAAAAVAVAASALTLSVTAHAADMPNTLTAEESAAGWQLLFDGKSLENWRASDQPGSFSVKDGAIVVRGPRSHLFYTGPVQQHDFKNFELKVEVMTFPKANSGVYFHTKWQEVGWPELGYEVQVNNSHSDPSRTGGLWGVQDYMKVVSPDNQWFTLTVRVEGKHVTTFVNSEKTADYTEESPIVRKKGLEKRYLASGTFALQGHDPESEAHFRNIKVRVLP
ncbi:3-keto-disaccharide hydrolase [Roseateles chitinivorans]|uniref:3-keto-disaccharide hydrolase n=1 Tax=Roseateles chitinivorans TaxID=2917965 RepID=UPI003D66B1F0